MVMTIPTLTTIGPAESYEIPYNPLEIYDGSHWDYVLSTNDAVLLRGTRKRNGEKGGDAVYQLVHKIKRSGLMEMRSTWGFTI